VGGSLDLPTEEKREPWGNIFDKVFPYFLSIGMTHKQFWYDDPWLVKAYREADKLKQKRFNDEAWLQGMYVYDAVSIVHYNFNKKKGAKAINYPKQPYDFFAEQDTKSEEDKVIEARAQATVWLSNLVNSYKK